MGEGAVFVYARPASPAGRSASPAGMPPITRPGDATEREADALASHTAPTDHARAAAPVRQAQTRPEPQAVPSGDGRPLDAAERAGFESPFDHDFSKVRVHSGAEAAVMANSFRAAAYAIGHDIVLGDGTSHAGTAGPGQLAHELAHVVQYDRSGHAVVARNTPRPGPPPNPGVHHYEETPLPGGRVRMHAWGVVGDKLERPGLEKKFPEPGRIGLAGNDRWHLAGPDATGTENGIAYASHNFNVGKTAQVENVIRRARLAVQEHGGEVFYDFQADCRIVGEFEGVSIRVVEDVRWSADVRAAGRDQITPILDEQVTLPSAASVTLRPQATTPTTRAHAPARTPAPSGAPTPEPARIAETTAEVGAPLAPVSEATPGFRPERGAGIGGAFQILQAMQVSNLQKAEINKFEDRLAKLQPKIDKFLDAGYAVELLLIVEKPNSVDLLSTVYMEQSQLVYFRDLFINYVESEKVDIRALPPPTTSGPSMSSAGGRSGYVPYTHEGGSIIEEGEIPFLTPKFPDHHCEYAKETRHPDSTTLAPLPAATPRRTTQAEKKPRLDPAARRALANAPSRVYVMSTLNALYRVIPAVMAKLAGNPSFGEVKEEMGGGIRPYTFVSYSSDLDKARAEVLRDIVRAAGVPAARSEVSGDGGGDPGVLTIWFGDDAKR